MHMKKWKFNGNNGNKVIEKNGNSGMMEFQVIFTLFFLSVGFIFYNFIKLILYFN